MDKMIPSVFLGLLSLKQEVKMSILKLFVAMSVLAGPMLVNAERIQYDPEGSGSWADPTRWVGGIAPAQGDTVVIRASEGAELHVTATDQDLATVLRAGAFRLYANTSLTFAFSGEQSVSAQFLVDSGGRLVKSGAGDLTLAGAFNLNPEIDVAAGTLTVRPDGNDCANVIFSVESGATLNLDLDAAVTTFPIGGLRGSGTVSNTSPGTLQLRFASGTEADPNVFSGTFSPGNLAFSAFGGAQLLPCNVASWNLPLRFYTGYLGFGDASLYANPVPSNFWIQFQGSSADGETGLIYLGANGECNRTATFYGVSPSRIDGGASGGLTVTGKWTMKPAMNDIILSGSNTTACVLANEIAEGAGGATSASITKKGTGAWRMAAHASRNNAGLVAVDQGRLEFESIAEAGSVCSLGLSTLLYEPHVGASADSSKAVPYAIRIGNGTSLSAGSGLPSDLATLAYVGTGSASCTTRPVAIDGAGRLASDGTGPLSLCGATSIGGGEQLLALSGNMAGNVLQDVTNGVGTLSVVKEGTGTWTLSRDIDIGGDLVSKGGTLALDNAAPKYRWYRLRICKLSPNDTDNVHYFQACEIGLFNADGERLNLPMAYQESANGNATALEAGNAAFGYASVYIYGSFPFANLFDGVSSTAARVCAQGAEGYKTVPDPENEATWPTIVMRVADDADPVTRYDILSSNGGTYKRAAWTWVMEGSVDGTPGSWKALHAVTNNPSPVSADARWYSSDTSAFTTGYEISPTGGETGATMSAVRMVEVSGGGEIVSGKPVTVGGIRCDVSAGGGVLDGFAFANEGTLNIQLGGADGAELPIEFRNATDLANVAGWTLMVDGRKSIKKICVSNGKVRVCPPGLKIILR